MYLHLVLKDFFIYNELHHNGFYIILNTQTSFIHNNIFKHIYIYSKQRYIIFLQIF